jgi:hypothetical protein
VNTPVSLEVPTPDPLREHPPEDRYCDLILNGGVASGVVYPWAVLELARHYRFRNIGGNSVGAMAAALAAAAEYGRCLGYDKAFEALRRSPLELAAERNGKAGMFRLFHPHPKLKRPFEAFLIFVDSANRFPGLLRKCWAAFKLYHLGDVRLPLALVLLGLLRGLWVEREGGSVVCGALGGLGAALLLGLAIDLVVVACRLLADFRALQRNNYGLCSGKSQHSPQGQDPCEEALIEWLNRGIQIAAKRDKDDPPLTFDDLWTAPRDGLQREGEPAEKSIRLEMFSTNITQGRPLRLPLACSCTPGTSTRSTTCRSLSTPKSCGRLSTCDSCDNLARR